MDFDKFTPFPKLELFPRHHNLKSTGKMFENDIQTQMELRFHFPVSASLRTERKLDFYYYNIFQNMFEVRPNSQNLGKSSLRVQKQYPVLSIT